MKIDFQKIKKYLPLAVLILAVVVIVLAVISIDACNVKDSLSLKLGEYKATVEAVTKEKNDLLQDIDAKKAIILKKDTEIAEYKTKAAEKEGKIKDLDNQLPEIAVALKMAKNDTERVPLFKKQVDICVAKFDLSKGEISDKNKEIDAWSKKFDAQVIIANDNKAGWENAENQAIKCEAVRKELEKRLKKARFFSKAKTVVVVAAVGYLAYNLLKK